MEFKSRKSVQCLSFYTALWSPVEHKFFVLSLYIFRLLYGQFPRVIIIEVTARGCVLGALHSEKCYYFLLLRPENRSKFITTMHRMIHHFYGITAVSTGILGIYIVKCKTKVNFLLAPFDPLYFFFKSYKTK
jgi:hypothetical protein